jgi:hypothetical protein
MGMQVNCNEQYANRALVYIAAEHGIDQKKSFSSTISAIT